MPTRRSDLCAVSPTRICAADTARRARRFGGRGTRLKATTRVQAEPQALGAEPGQRTNRS